MRKLSYFWLALFFPALSLLSAEEVEDTFSRIYFERFTSSWAFNYFHKDRMKPLWEDRDIRTSYSTITINGKERYLKGGIFFKQSIEAGDKGPFNGSVGEASLGSQESLAGIPTEENWPNLSPRRNLDKDLRQGYINVRHKGKKVEVLQSVEVKHEYPGFLMTYTITNISSEELSIGFRTLIDTHNYPGGDDFTLVWRDLSYDEELQWYGDTVPVQWSTTRSTKRSNRLFFGVPEGDRPDRMVFANWKILDDGGWKYRYRALRGYESLPYSLNDSAVALFYDPVVVPPGESITRTYLYGTTLLPIEPQKEEPKYYVEAPQKPLPPPVVPPPPLPAGPVRAGVDLERLNRAIRDMNTGLGGERISNEYVELDEEVQEIDDSYRQLQ